MSDLGGQLEIRLDPCSGAVTIGSSRPVTAARVFAGKSPAEVVRQLPTLFSLCGTAQAEACVGACEQALGLQPSAAVLARRQALVQAETIKEHLWRLLLDWPKMLEPMADIYANANANANAAGNARASTAALPASASAMPRVMQAFMALRQAQQAAGDPFSLDAQQAEGGAAAAVDVGRLLGLVTEQALGAAPADWQAEVDHLVKLQRWAEQTTTPAAGLVCALVAQGLAGCGANSVARLPDSPWQRLASSLASAEADAFITAPQWQQGCAETGPLARVAAQPLVADLLARYGNGLLTRLAALLVDLAQSAGELEAMLNATIEGTSHADQSFAPDLVSPKPLADAFSGSDSEDPQLQGSGRTVTPASLKLTGVGYADAARGLLVHRVTLVNGRVEKYQILAPTEWNFHPQGVVAKGLAAIARSGAEGPELERLARLFITAVDPCVDYQLSVS